MKKGYFELEIRGIILELYENFIEKKVVPYYNKLRTVERVNI